MTIKPNRGEIWLLDLNPTLGREQGGSRPCLVISDNMLNHGPADLAIVIPITSKDKGIASHVRVEPPEGGLREVSFVKTEDIRSVSVSERFVKRFGTIDTRTLQKVERNLGFLLQLS